MEQACFYNIYNHWISDASRAYLKDYRYAELTAVIEADDVQGLFLLLVSSHLSKTKSTVAAAMEAEEALHAYRMTSKMTVYDYNRGYIQHLQSFATAEALVDPDFRLARYKFTCKVKERWIAGLVPIFLTG